MNIGIIQIGTQHNILITEHRMNYQHKFDWENIKILGKERILNKRILNKRLISEIIHIKHIHRNRI